MLDRARSRFAGESGVTFTEYDLADPLPRFGRFDLVLSGFAIHHVEDDVKRARYAEIFDLLLPGGRFINVEHVSPTEQLHRDFKVALGIDKGDRSNRCSPVEDQLSWLRDIGFVDVDCLWKWREMALLHARRPALARPAGEKD
jgi:SAM-dependent methyltransferase